jgi:hypothetical protein
MTDAESASAQKTFSYKFCEMVLRLRRLMCGMALPFRCNPIFFPGLRPQFERHKWA